MSRRLRLLTPILLGLALASCTAIKVVTHNPSTDATKAPAGTYRIDPDHAHVSFGVDHFRYSKARGRFDDVTGELTFNPDDPTLSTLQVTLDTSSITTGAPILDQLLSNDLFTESQVMTFSARSIVLTGESSGTILGELAHGGKTTAVSLETTFNGGAPNPLTGVYTLGFSAVGRFDRSDLGLGKWLPAVGNQVSVLIEIEFLYQGA